MAQITPAIIKAIGLKDPKGDLSLIEVPLKQLGSKDLLVRIEAVSVNPVDYKKLQSIRTQNISQDNPVILGFDASGVVVKIGSDCKLFNVGDQVIYSGEYTKHGSNANYQIVDERIVGNKPRKLSHAEAAAIPLVSLTAYEGIVEEMRISPTEKQHNQNKNILIVGAAGGVGSSAIQIAKKFLGLTVIATASRKESIDFCKKMGADFVINHQNPLAEELNKLNISSLDYIFNCVEMKSSYFEQFASLIKPFGRIVGVVGFDEPLNLQLLFLKRAKISIECMFTRSMFGEQPEKQNQILNKISELYDKGILIPTVQKQKQFSLDSLIDAHNLSKSGKTVGKISLFDVQSFFGVEKKVQKKTSCFGFF
ncbi:zinc-binding alcohol dehydrogenase family protein (macronuclear) [Tetrahymena thermophila SB210]|uniref:Zinc-binding alcohol dehydrogenase family protein n=1 Tax=Tetrahymena thermophila (strain SB210) TaxID=312017 RepID=I7M1I0_TETTS|nr:zinc-binding alcohol dehydrogenase family protein [Tetrahymena thermophila SB210]EAR96382.1 zinc-binding alcohol dehydrogenase family protein [Tetrahymena thermophila SB210]|eukprot:XP_001016627.1 zinc-binding alcohol dehydrogenase family protein [Tetrahymena thermophila SB210]